MNSLLWKCTGFRNWIVCNFSAIIPLTVTYAWYMLNPNPKVFHQDNLWCGQWWLKIIECSRIFGNDQLILHVCNDKSHVYRFTEGFCYSHLFSTCQINASLWWRGITTQSWTPIVLRLGLCCVYPLERWTILKAEWFLRYLGGNLTLRFFAYSN